MNVEFITKTYTAGEMARELQSFLEIADDISILVLYEYLFDRDCSEIELEDEDFDNMFHHVDALISNDFAKGELIYVMMAMHIATNLTFQKTYQNESGVFEFEFKGPKEDDIIDELENEWGNSDDQDDF
jgi:hypothetical protein